MITTYLILARAGRKNGMKTSNFKRISKVIHFHKFTKNSGKLMNIYYNYMYQDFQKIRFSTS